MQPVSHDTYLTVHFYGFNFKSLNPILELFHHNFLHTDEKQVLWLFLCFPVSKTYLKYNYSKQHLNYVQVKIYYRDYFKCIF